MRFSAAVMQPLMVEADIVQTCAADMRHGQGEIIIFNNALSGFALNLFSQ